MEVINYLLKKEREFVSLYMDTSNMSNKEIDKQFDLIMKELTNDRTIKKKENRFNK